MSDTAIEIRPDQKALVMKSGLVHWITISTAERLQVQLQGQAGHTFIKIAELSITINSAEIEGVYGIEEYERLAKIKQGMWQCEYRTWHERKNICTCARDISRRQFDERRKQEVADSTRPRTPEEQSQMKETLKTFRKDLEKKGILTPKK